MTQLWFIAFDRGCRLDAVCLCLTPNASALMGNVVLQISTKGCLSSSTADTPIIHQKESLAVVVQAAGVTWCVLDIVTSREASLQTQNRGVNVSELRDSFRDTIYSAAPLLIRSEPLILHDTQILFWWASGPRFLYVDNQVIQIKMLTIWHESGFFVF